MLDILLIFEVHQPYRLKKNLFWKNKLFRRLNKKELFNYYFDNEANKEVFMRAAKKCYYPANQILLDLIDKYKNEKKKAKFAFSISGVFLSLKIQPLIICLPDKSHAHLNSYIIRT